MKSPYLAIPATLLLHGGTDSANEGTSRQEDQAIIEEVRLEEFRTEDCGGSRSTLYPIRQLEAHAHLRFLNYRSSWETLQQNSSLVWDHSRT